MAEFEKQIFHDPTDTLNDSIDQDPNTPDLLSTPLPIATQVNGALKRARSNGPTLGHFDLIQAAADEQRNR